MKLRRCGLCDGWVAEFRGFECERPTRIGAVVAVLWCAVARWCTEVRP